MTYVFLILACVGGGFIGYHAVRYITEIIEVAIDHIQVRNYFGSFIRKQFIYQFITELCKKQFPNAINTDTVVIVATIKRDFDTNEIILMQMAILDYLNESGIEGSGGFGIFGLMNRVDKV